MENSGFIKRLMMQLSGAEENIVAFSLYDGKQVTNVSYRQFLDDILKAAGYFGHRKIQNRHVAIAAANSYDWIVVFFGILCSGNVAVFLNQDLPQSILQQQCEQADVSIICTDASYFAEFCASFTDTECLPFEQVRAGMPISAEEVHSADPDDTIIMMSTSGTTGKSKIVAFSSYNVQAAMDDLRNSVHCENMNRLLLTFPLFHISGLVPVTLQLWNYETTCIGQGIRYILTDMSVLNPSIVPMVPSVLDSMVKLLNRTKTEVERQKHLGTNLAAICVAGASAKPDLCRYMMGLGIEVQSSYGMTESTGSGTWCVWTEGNIGSIGKPYGRNLCRIVDGELQLKGPAVMKGYYKDPAETAKIIEDGWLHTGDLVYCDENGYYYLTGRKKNVIILSNGENVNPEEIEAKFGECRDILECMVYGDGKGICADIYASNQSSAEKFIKGYNEEVPLYRQIYKVHYSDTPLEKTGSGKIKRKENVYA